MIVKLIRAGARARAHGEKKIKKKYKKTQEQEKL